MLKATKNDYGLIAKIFHWTFALVIMWQILTGINLHNMDFSNQKAMFIWYHQFTGTFIFCLISLRLMWKLYNKTNFENNLPPIHKWTSKIVHFALYTLCIWLPIQGSLMTWAGGYDVYILGFTKLPVLFQENKDMYPMFVKFHFYTSILLLILIISHISAGIYHKFFINDKYKIWVRMTFGIKE